MRKYHSLLRCACVLLFTLAMHAPVRAQQKGLEVVPVTTADGQRLELYRGSHALLIGVSRYTAGWPNLESVPGELDRLEQALDRQGFSVTRVNNPDHNALRAKLDDFFVKHGLERNNRLLIFFSGHGFTRTVGNDTVGYLVPADAPNPVRDEPGFLRAALRMDEVLVFARKIESKHALFLFDSCFSGTIFKSKALPVPRHITVKTERPVRQFISAGSAGEPVPAQSVFLPTLIRALEGEGDLNRDGYVTGSELGMYLHDRVVDYATGQTPQYGKINDPDLDEGDFVFALARAEPQAPPLPGDADFSLEDIAGQAAREEASRRAWAAKLEQMRAAAREVEALEARDVSPELKIQGWERFLAAFAEDNPYSAEDQALRTRAGERRAHWEREQRRLAEEQRRRDEEASRRQQQAAIVPPVATPPTENVWRDPITGMEFVLVPGGEYEQGCGHWARDCSPQEWPTRRVSVNPFWIGKTEVTQGHWKRIMQGNPSYFKKDDNHPVDQVSWDDVQEFIKRLNSKSTSKYRLPTESEWEYACRSGGKPINYGTPTGNLDVSLANFQGSSSVTVGSFPPNQLGILDMSGNVGEWVQDVYHHRSYSGERAPLVLFGPDARVVRGGAWDSGARHARCTSRAGNLEDERFSNLGFRLVKPK
jgi:formylglycine-generating enzyme required for sulfatase activity